MISPYILTSYKNLGGGVYVKGKFPSNGHEGNGHGALFNFVQWECLTKLWKIITINVKIKTNVKWIGMIN
jgi:hypothetical protein